VPVQGCTLPYLYATSAPYFSVIRGYSIGLRPRCNLAKSHYTPTKKSTNIVRSCVDAALCFAVMGRTQPQCLSKCHPVKKGVCAVCLRSLMKIKTDDFALGTSESEDMKWLVRYRDID